MKVRHFLAIAVYLVFAVSGFMGGLWAVSNTFSLVSSHSNIKVAAGVLLSMIVVLAVVSLISVVGQEIARIIRDAELAQRQAKLAEKEDVCETKDCRCSH